MKFKNQKKKKVQYKSELSRGEQAIELIKRQIYQTNKTKKKQSNQP